MAEQPNRLDDIDLLRVRLLSALEELERERLTNTDLQRQNAHITLALLTERRERVVKQHAFAEAQLIEVGKMLERKYGVTAKDEIDWETGEIKSEKETTTDTTEASDV